MEYILSEDQKDCLQELINISYGKATSRIAEVLNAFATMQVPSIHMLGKEEFLDILKKSCENSSENYLTIQLFKGEFAGESIFLLDAGSAKNLVEHLKEENEDETIDDVVAELTNIVTSTLIFELAKKLHADVMFDEPFISKISQNNYRKSSIKSDYEYIIMINTIMEFREQNIFGEVFILSHEKSFQWLQSALEQAIEEYF